MKDEISFYTRWVAWYLWDQVKETYHSLPGPWWVKLAIVAVCIAIPGPQDEILLILVVKACRWYRNRSARA